VEVAWRGTHPRGRSILGLSKCVLESVAAAAPRSSAGVPNPMTYRMKVRPQRMASVYAKVVE